MDMNYLTSDGRPIHQPLAARFDRMGRFPFLAGGWIGQAYWQASRVYDATWDACNDAQERILDAIRDGVCPVCGSDETAKDYYWGEFECQSFGCGARYRIAFSVIDYRRVK